MDNYSKHESDRAAAMADRVRSESVARADWLFAKIGARRDTEINESEEIERNYVELALLHAELGIARAENAVAGDVHDANAALISIGELGQIRRLNIFGAGCGRTASYRSGKTFKRRI